MFKIAIFICLSCCNLVTYGMEIWKDIANYEGLYQVSNTGRIKSCERTKTLRGGYERFVPEKIKNTLNDRYGYPSVRLCKEGKKKPFTIHRLVAIHFIENPCGKLTVNHVDGIKTNNNVLNLEWATMSEQIKHAFRIGLKVSPSKIRPGMLGKFGKDHNQSKPIIQLTMDGNVVREWECAADAKRIAGFTPTQISRCCHGLSSYHKGYLWKLKNPVCLTT